ncbi:MAG TPA: c-type cytochrome [Candidatus Ozemobacteraceae bacterium]
MNVRSMRGLFLMLALIVLVPCAFAAEPATASGSNTITIVNGTATTVFPLAELQKLPAETITGYEPVGTKKGPLGKHDWLGAGMPALLLTAIPGIDKAEMAQKRVVVKSVDGWTVSFRAGELFGDFSGGRALYAVKGCNECHGANAEGSAPPGKKAAPALVNRSLPAALIGALLRANHGDVKFYGPDRVSEDEIAQITAWLNAPDTATGSFRIDPAKNRILLAWQRDGQPLTPADGLIQLVVEYDQFAGRFSHWVDRIEIE